MAKDLESRECTVVPVYDPAETCVECVLFVAKLVPSVVENKPNTASHAQWWRKLFSTLGLSGHICIAMKY